MTAVAIPGRRGLGRRGLGAWPGEAWPGGVAWGGVAWGGHYVRTEKRKEGRKLDRVMTICLEETH